MIQLCEISLGKARVWGGLWFHGMSTPRDPSHPTSKQAECECISWVGSSRASLPEASQDGGGKRHNDRSCSTSSSSKCTTV